MEDPFPFLLTPHRNPNPQMLKPLVENGIAFTDDLHLDAISR
jgi:hypothetical protein